MVKIRKDFEGFVWVDGKPLTGGDDIPAGACVGGHLTASGKAVGVVAPPVAVEGGVVPLSMDEQARAGELGIPVDAHPERVRGALDGYAQAQADILDAQVEAEQAAELEAAETADQAAKD